MKSLLIRMRLALLRKSIERWGNHICKASFSATACELRVLMQEQAVRRSKEKVLTAKLRGLK